MVASLSTEQGQRRVADIPVIDLGPYMSGESGALAQAAEQLREALETVGFFIMINHGVPRELIAQTFDEAKRFHAQPMAAKTALRMNEHNNGYMAMGRYAVWTSDVNDNDKPGSSQSRHLSGLTSLHIFRPSQGQPGLANLIITIE